MIYDLIFYETGLIESEQGGVILSTLLFVLDK